MKTCKRCDESDPAQFRTSQNQLCLACLHTFKTGKNTPRIKTYMDYVKESGQYEYYRRYINTWRVGTK